MEIINHVIGFVKANWIGVLAILGGLDLILGVITSWTPFKWDDNLYTMFHNAVAKLVKK